MNSEEKKASRTGASRPPRGGAPGALKMGLLRAAFILVAGCAAAGLTFVGYALYTREAYREKIFPEVHVSF